MEHILIIEDDSMIAELERDYLEASGFEVHMESNGKIGCDLLLKELFDAAILDIMLPGMDGFAICREVRKTLHIPIILVTARKSEADIIRGLNCGADDYLVKPFNPSELVARLKAHIVIHKRLLQERERQTKCIEIQDLRLFPNERRVYLGEQEIFLVNKEFELLLFLAENPNIAFSRELLFDRVWGLEANGNTSTVTVHINRIREKIDRDREKPLIATVWGVGYRFCVK